MSAALLRFQRQYHIEPFRFMEQQSKQEAVQLGVIPKKMNINSDGKTVYNTWGGKVVIKGNGDNGFILTYPKVPSGSVCVDLIRNQRKVGWDNYGVGTSADKQFSGLNNKDLTVSCASTKDYVDVVFQSGEKTTP